MDVSKRQVLKHSAILLSATIVVGILFAYSSLDVASVSDQSIGENEKIAAESYNEMGFEMAETMHRMEDDNVVFSPLSVGIAYSMAYTGSEGDTREELGEFLNVEVRDQEFHDSNRELLKALENPEPNYTYKRMFGMAKNVETNLANGIWFRDGLNYREDYRNNMEEYYDARIRERPLDSAALEEINSWTEKNTEGEIEKILEDLGSNPAAVLVNAVYFNGEWANKFEEDMTEEEEFTRKDNSTVTVQMMEKEDEKLQYVELDENWNVDEPGSTFRRDEENIDNKTLQAVRLPYGETGRLGMYVVLPEDIDRLVEELNQEKWDQITENTEETKIDLKMPKYEADYDADLIEVTKEMGLEEPYKGSANFQKMASGIQAISKAKHKATVDVDESGTEAAAATALVMNESGSIGKPRMIVDQPFMFAIVDQKSGSIMFQGIIRDPS